MCDTMRLFVSLSREEDCVFIFRVIQFAQTLQLWQGVRPLHRSGVSVKFKLQFWQGKNPISHKRCHAKSLKWDIQQVRLVILNSHCNPI